VLSLLGMLFALDSLRPKFPNIASNMMSFLSFRTQGQFNTICRLFFFFVSFTAGTFRRVQRALASFQSRHFPQQGKLSLSLLIVLRHPIKFTSVFFRISSFPWESFFLYC
jgi:hypothetical protein